MAHMYLLPLGCDYPERPGSLHNYSKEGLSFPDLGSRV